MRRLARALLAGVAAAALAACTDVGTDPDAVVAIRFDGSPYPSIVAGDSLRDSLGKLQPLQITALNYKGDSVPGAPAVFSSPDTILQMMPGGVVFARGPKTDGTPARVFATIGSLQSQPDTLFVVGRADTLRAGKTLETMTVGPSGGTTGPDSLPFFAFGDTAATKPKAPVRSWLVSFQLRYHGALLAPTDTTIAYTFETGLGTPPRRVPTFIDTTDTQGKVARRVFVRSITGTAAEDTIFLIATLRARKPDVPPVKSEATILLRRP